LFLEFAEVEAAGGGMLGIGGLVRRADEERRGR
jgi:hypothetical protein